MTERGPQRWATWTELARQGDVWRGWGLAFDPVSLARWVEGLGVEEIWLSGAGSSAYVGDIVAAALVGAPPRVRAVPSTDIVSRPRDFLAGKRPLVISFGRSGNSAETVGVLDALDALAPDAPQLNITCNAAGALAKRSAGADRRAIVLPDETHDTGFAMTSSFTTMLLTALGVFANPEDWTDRVTALADAFDMLMGRKELAELHAPSRIVFVGAGPLAFAAREAALKVMELSAGQIPALWDSTLGFRHGPKSFVRDDTLIVAFRSSNAETRRYDDDLARELRDQFPGARVVTAGPGADIDIAFPGGDGWGAALAVVLAQILAVRWSDAMGLNVDDPFAGQGTLTRVVSDVRLYEVRA